MNYNRQSEYEEISAHNDAFLMEWTNEKSSKTHVGSSALHLNPELNYKLVWPIQRGIFNSRDYSHVREVVEDLGELWRGAIVHELNVNLDDFKNYCIVLVLPDSFDRAQVKNCIEALMSGNNPFRAITVIQESQGVCFGCGVSSGVVVDCGAQKISIACIEEGFLVPESRVKIPVGGDEITRLLAELLKLHEFPYQFDLKKPLEWELLDELKERCCTVNDSEITPSAAIFEFYVRKPEELTKKFLFKMFEERIMAPLALFDSEIPLLAGQSTNLHLHENKLLSLNAFDLEDPFVEPTEDMAVALPPVVNDKEEIVNALPDIICNWNNCGNCFQGLTAAFDHFNNEHLQKESVCCKFPDCSYSSVNDLISLQCHVIENHFNNNNNLMHLNPQRFDSYKHSINNSSVLIENFNDPMSIDDSIIFSLLKLEEAERIKRCASSIILSGGSHLFSGFSSVLFDKITSKIQLNPLTALLEVKIFPNSRDLDARFLAWKGGSVFSKLESTSEAWISCAEWQNFGARSIKEKISFIN